MFVCEVLATELQVDPLLDHVHALQETKIRKKTCDWGSCHEPERGISALFDVMGRSHFLKSGPSRGSKGCTSGKFSDRIERKDCCKKR